MTSACDRYRELLVPFAEGQLDESVHQEVREHLAACDDCSELADVLATITGAGDDLATLAPPEGLAADLAASPCRRWLGLLFGAVDRQITEPNLERLLSHLDSCPSCRQTWTDLTLIHQVADVLEPPPGLLGRCASVRRRPPTRRLAYSRRVATAAAYILAVVVSLTVGNPVSIARSPMVQDLAGSVTSGVQQMALDSRGELRVMVWRIWRWGARQVQTVRNLVEPASNGPGADSKQGES